VRPVLFATPAPKTVIVTHHKPDADALGSSLGLYHYLKLKGIDAQVISPTDYGDFLFWMPSNEAVMNFEENPEEAIRLVEAADLVFCLDFNSSNVSIPWVSMWLIPKRKRSLSTITRTPKIR
jgi:phosphoesterase RecJ-like protein